MSKLAGTILQLHRYTASILTFLFFLWVMVISILIMVDLPDEAGRSSAVLPVNASPICIRMPDGLDVCDRP
ncbi:MAG: hypothetical protein ABJN40_01585 [Sneathiella sp.]